MDLRMIKKKTKREQEQRYSDAARLGDVSARVVQEP
jgi:hypothetical protein